jgi:hemoglobin/transferrin/lactoferrin receptor protein
MNKKPLVIAVTLAIFNAASVGAYAADNKAVTELDAVVVNATRIDESLTKSSRAIVKISAAQLEELQAASVAKALKHEANISVTNGPRPSAQGVEIRGLSGNRVLQTVDDARQNAGSGHRGTYFIDPEMLKSIEVLKGPSSSLWGSGAIGGVVAQYTKSAQDFLEEDEQFGGYLKQGYETNGSRTKTSGSIYGIQDSVDWLFNASYLDSNNIKVGNDETLNNSASMGRSALAKLGWQLDDAQRLELSLRSNNSNELVPSNPSAEVSRSVPLVRRETTDNNLSLAYELNPTDNAYLDAKALIYVNQTDYDEDRVTKGQIDATEFNTLGLSLSNKSIFGKGTGRTELVYGVDGYKDTIETVRDDKGQTGQRPGNIDGEVSTLGAFVTAKVSLSDTVSVEPALRYDSFSNQSNNLGLEIDDSAVSPSLALVWQSTPWLNLSARYDEAFRAPSIEEMYSSGSHYCIPPIPRFLPNGMCNTFAINPDLKAEKAKNKELKADFSFSELSATGADDELNLTLSVFRNDVDDFIVQSVSNPLMGIPGFEQTTSWDNVSSAELTGFEISSRYRYNQTRLSINYGQTQGKDADSNEYIANIPANKLSLDLSQGIMEGDVKLGTRLSYVASQTDVPLDNKVAKYDDYKLWDIYVAWEPSMGDLAGLRVDFAIENIGDEQYKQAWQTLFEQGRNMKLSARYQF